MAHGAQRAPFSHPPTPQADTHLQTADETRREASAAVAEALAYRERVDRTLAQVRLWPAWKTRPPCIQAR